MSAIEAWLPGCRVLSEEDEAWKPKEEEEQRKSLSITSATANRIAQPSQCAWSTLLNLASTLYEMQRGEALHGCGKLSGVMRPIYSHNTLSRQRRLSLLVFAHATTLVI